MAILISMAWGGSGRRCTQAHRITPALGNRGVPGEAERECNLVSDGPLGEQRVTPLAACLLLAHVGPLVSLSLSLSLSLRGRGVTKKRV